MLCHLPTAGSLAVVLAAALLAVPACNNKPSAENQASMQALNAPAQIYTVRGVITALPVGDDPRQMLRIHHEAIPTFKDEDGTVHQNPDGTPGMKSMEMPFSTLGPNVHLEGLAVGDKITFTLAIAREPRTMYAITSIEKLPADTELDFGSRKP